MCEMYLLVSERGPDARAPRVCPFFSSLARRDGYAVPLSRRGGNFRAPLPRAAGHAARAGGKLLERGARGRAHPHQGLAPRRRGLRPAAGRSRAPPLRGGAVVARTARASGAVPKPPRGVGCQECRGVRVGPRGPRRERVVRREETPVSARVRRHRRGQPAVRQVRDAPDRLVRSRRRASITDRGAFSRPHERNPLSSLRVPEFAPRLTHRHRRALLRASSRFFADSCGRNTRAPLQSL